MASWEKILSLGWAGWMNAVRDVERRVGGAERWKISIHVKWCVGFGLIQRLKESRGQWERK